LLAAAADSDLRPRIEQILSATGRKALILGGTEIVLAAGLGINAMQVMFSKGRSKLDEEWDITEKDGERHIVYRRKTS